MKLGIHCNAMFLIGILGVDNKLDPLVLLLLALIVEAALGQFKGFNKLAGLPFEWMAKYISWCDAKLNRESRSPEDRAIRGAIAVLLLIIFSGVLGWLVGRLSQRLEFVWILETIMIISMIKQFSNFHKIRGIILLLRYDEAAAIRVSVNTLGLKVEGDENLKDIICGLIQYLACSISRKGVAPIFWYVLFGLPGLLIYSSISIMDECIDVEYTRHKAFGFATNRLNLIVSFVPDLVSGFAILVSSAFVPNASPINSAKSLNSYKNAIFVNSQNSPICALFGSLCFNFEVVDKKRISQSASVKLSGNRDRLNVSNVFCGLYISIITFLLGIGCVGFLAVLRLA